MPVVAVVAAIAILEVLGLAARAERHTSAYVSTTSSGCTRSKTRYERLRLPTEDLLPGGIAALDQPVDAARHQQVVAAARRIVDNSAVPGRSLDAPRGVNLVGRRTVVPISRILVGVRSRLGICVILKIISARHESSVTALMMLTQPMGGWLALGAQLWGKPLSVGRAKGPLKSACPASGLPVEPGAWRRTSVRSLSIVDPWRLSVINRGALEPTLLGRAIA